MKQFPMFFPELNETTDLRLFLLFVVKALDWQCQFSQIFLIRALWHKLSWCNHYVLPIFSCLFHSALTRGKSVHFNVQRSWEQYLYSLVISLSSDVYACVCVWSCGLGFYFLNSWNCSKRSALTEHNSTDTT